MRAVSRTDGEVEWEAKDLGSRPNSCSRTGPLRPTGGQFTRLKDGETTERGPYGVSAIDAGSGKVLWRWKGADKGITNLVLPDASTVLVADRDDLIALDAATGKRRSRSEHGVKGAAFIILNERGQAVVGGREELAAFDAATANASGGRTRRRARHIRRCGGSRPATASLTFARGLRRRLPRRKVRARAAR